MERFAPIYGEWSAHHGSYTWQKLATATDFIGYKWTGGRPRAARGYLVGRPAGLDPLLGRLSGLQPQPSAGPPGAAGDLYSVSLILGFVK
jgi:hypothetical protein